MVAYEFSGGPVRRAHCIYVQREADREVLDLLSDHQLVILTAPRQTGKTSLMRNVLDRLCDAGNVVCSVDFRERPGRVQDPSEWFRLLFYSIAREVGLDVADLNEWLLSVAKWSWTNQATDFFRTFVRQRIDAPITIAFDEIDVLRILAYHTDEFFEALRALFSSRDSLRIGFLLIGLNHPADLLKVADRSSFNIGSQVMLPDFFMDDETVHAWSKGFEAPPDIRMEVGREILRQTGGQPYLTSRLFHELNSRQAKNREDVARFAEEFVENVRQRRLTEVHFDAPGEIIRDNESSAYRVVSTYKRILSAPLPVVELDRKILAVLRTTGLTLEKGGEIGVKSPMYRSYFDERWCKLLESAIGSPEYFPTSFEAPRPDKRICVINTGGTIGMELLPNGKMGQPSDLRMFFRNYADIFKVAEIDPVALCCKDGANIFPEEWKLLAQAIFQRRNEGYAGFVIACGTDTLAFTASALAFALGPSLSFPVVFTGAQAPSHVLHGDAKINLLRACEVAIQPIPEVVVAFGEGVFRAVRVAKKDDYRFEGFHSPTYRPLALIAERIELQRDLLRIPAAGWLTDLKADFSPGIVQIAQTPGLEPSLFLGLLENPDLKGIIVQSLGIGNLPTEGRYSFQPLIEAAVARDIPVLIISPYPVLPEFVANYTPASAPLQWGAISAGKMTPAAAATKFMWLLPQVEEAIRQGNVKTHHKLREVKRLMSTNFVGEVDLSSGAPNQDS